MCYRLVTRVNRPPFSSHSSPHLNIIMYWNEKEDKLEGLTLPKIPIISKKGSNKSCWRLNFLQKTVRSHVSISSQSGARALQRLPFSKYYYILKREKSSPSALYFSKFPVLQNFSKIFTILLLFKIPGQFPYHQIFPYDRVGTFH